MRKASCNGVFDSAQLYREKHHSVFDALEADGLLEGGLLFDFTDSSFQLKSGAIVPIPSTVSQKDNTMQFILWFQEFFHRDKSEKVKVLLEIECGLEKLFQDYDKRVSSCQDFTEERRRELIDFWEESTSILLWDVFCGSYRFASSGYYLDSRDILKRSLWALARRKEDILYPHKDCDPSDVLLYNFWGESYFQKRADFQKNKMGLPADQRALLFNDENKETFNLFFSDRYEAAMRKSGQRQDFYLTVEVDAMAFLESLFIDYAKRLRRAGLYDQLQTKNAINQWRDVTVSEINRMSLIEEVSITMLSPSFILAPDFRGIPVTREVYNTICRVRSLADKSKAAINGFVENYLKIVNEGGMAKSWSERLLAVRIDYRGLYSDMMREKILGPDVDYTAFEDAFRSADFSLLIQSAQNIDSIQRSSGRQGFVKFLVKVVGGRVGDDWYYHAAETVEPKRKGKDAKFAVDKLKPTGFIKSNAPKILDVRIPGYHY